jgi:hypothetical protein
MKKIKLLLVFVFSTLLFLPAQAERVDAEKAEKVARSYARRTPRLSTQQNFRHIRTVSKRVQRKSVALRSASQQDDPMYHVFASDGGGFIIIAGDDVALPVLGYAGEGTYDESNPNLAYWMETLAQEIAWAIENGVRQDPGTQAAWEDFDNENSVSTRASGDYVDPLVKTKWDQGAPYNSQCPQISGTSTYTGCVATAMAQIMYYHTCPATTGTGSHSYTHSGAGQLSADFAATTYQWNSMTTTYSSSSGSAAKSAVATLMYHCGVSVNMNYGTKSSSASSGAVPNALATYFGYDAGASYLSRNIYSYTEWVNMLKNELRNDRPVYYSGSSSTGSGHAFVCDGYDTDDLFHINWGWAGSSDGYFEISALSPNAIGIGGGAGGYNTVQGMIIGVKPYAGGSSPDIQMGIADFYASKASLSSLTESFKITLIKVSNAGSVAISNTSLGIWLCKSDDTHVSYGVIYNDIPLNPGYYYSSITADFYTLPNNLQPGTYKLYPAYKQSGQSTPTVIPGENGDKYITVTVNSYNSVTLSSGSAVAPSLTLKSLSAEGNLYHNKPGSMKAEIENTGTGDYNAKLQIRLNNVAWATDPVVIPAGATKTIGFSDTVKLDAGSYTASLWYDPANVQSNNPSAQLGNDLTVEVKSTPAGSPSLSVESLSFSPDEDQVSINDLNLTVKIKNAGELYSSYVYIFIFPYSGGSSITSFRKSNVTIDKNETKTLVFNNPLDMLTAGTKYIVGVYAEVNGSRTMIGNLVPFTVKAHAPSFDATLKRITVKDAQTSTVLETFNVSSGTTAYNVDNVAATVTAISIIGEANESRAKFSNIENASFTGATKSYNITVTADDKTTTKTYTITLNRVAAAKYGVNIGTATGGSVTTPGNQNSYEAGTTVTLNVSPGTGYELDNISVHENDGSNTPVNLSGSGNTRTFTMPACAVTVTATFKKTDATLLSEANTLIEAYPYTVGEATANTEDGVKTWLAGQINALPSISQTGIDAVTKDNISTSSSFTAAHMGTDGSFSFTVTLKKNGSTAAAAVTGTITATPAFTVTINSGTNGAIQITPTIYHALETVTYTVFPATGYELNNILAYKTGYVNTPVSINTSSRSFTMPAHDVTVTATFKENVDQVAVIAARKAIEGATYTVAQATANDVNQVKAWLSAQFSALPAVNGITVNITKAAVAGTVGNLNGTDGQFTFTVDLQKGASATVTTASTTGTITATQAHTIAVGSNITNGGITALAAATEGTALT